MSSLVTDVVVFMLTTRVGLILTCAIAYYVSLILHPYVLCRSCKGESQHQGVVFNYAHGYCGRCEGAGERPRIGVRVLTPPSWHPGGGGE